MPPDPISTHCRELAALQQAIGLHWKSLKTRITLLTIVIALVGFSLLMILVGQSLRNDLKQLLADQQLNTVSLVASELSDALSFRQKALEDLAKTVPHASTIDPRATQALLEQHSVVESLFNSGVVAIDAQGTVVAEVPKSKQRLRLDLADRDYVQRALKENKSSISPPLSDRKTQHPVVVISVPIHDAQGQVNGVLAGIIDLNAPNFLDRITANRYGKTGETFIVTPQTRTIISTSDKKRTMEVLPAPGISPWIDRFMQGYEGSAVVVNPHGLEVLVSVKQVPVAGWYTSVILSTEEAFAPINATRRLLLTTVVPLMILLVGGLIWWMLRRQLQPLMNATQTLSTLAESEQPMQALPVVHQDEVGALIGGFNNLLNTLTQRQQALVESEGRFRALADNAAALVWMADADAHCIYFNKLWFDFTGRSLAQEISDNGDGWLQGVHPDDLKRRQAVVAEAFAARQPFDIDYRLRRFDGVYCWLTDHGVPRYDDQKTFLGYIGTCIDITDRKQSEAKQLLLASVFTHALEGILITAADGSIMDTNQAFSRITGYRADEVRGKNPRILNSGRHPQTFYADLWNSLIAKGEWTGEVWNRRKDGTHYVAMQTISAVRDEVGNTAHYVALFADITAIKEHETQLEQIAHFDTLTQLPNRLLLNDRLHLAMTQAQRRQHPLALVFIDLDGFKAINDEHGHKAGDYLLTTVASRMKLALREGDTLARMGGDEFVAVLLDIASNRDCVPILQRLLEAAAQPVAFGDAMLQVSASLGVAFYQPSDSLEPDPLLRHADQAMYEAKLAGKNRYRFYEPQKS